MFGNNKKDAQNSSPGQAAAHSLNTLTPGTVIQGNIQADSDIRIDGNIKGKLFCAAKVILGPESTMEGEIKCKQAVIEGKFNGQLFVEELLNVRETAVIDGDVHVGKLIVQPGAKFNVICNMGALPKDIKPKAAGSKTSAAESVKAADDH
jgi:cytoskeletal protein CcmA (bactofilin family)